MARNNDGKNTNPSCLLGLWPGQEAACVSCAHCGWHKEEAKRRAEMIRVYGLKKDESGLASLHLPKRHNNQNNAVISGVQQTLVL